MPIAANYEDLGGGLASWYAYDPETKVDLCSTALTLGSRLFFVDPIPLHLEPLFELTAEATPTGILLTNANHARAAETFRQRFSVPVCFSEAAAGTIGIKGDILLSAAPQAVFDGAFVTVPLPGGAPGELALFRPARDGGVLVVGDALIHLAADFMVLPDKYCADPALLRESLAGLLPLPFNKLLFAHGDPLLAGARARLQTLLAA